MKKKITLEQVGFAIYGQASINLWGGGLGTIDMDRRFIPYEKMSRQALLDTINDGGFGCESIDSADIDIYIVFEGGFEQYDRCMAIDCDIHIKSIN